MLAVVGPHAGGLLLGVAIYGLVLGGTAAFSARCSPLVAAGGALFLTSDSILALRLFLPDGLPAWSDPAVMLTYTLGQGLIVAGALAELQQRSTR
ncbi:lysoplasmalogenase family protein [Microbacterium sp. 179-I 3D2 NHS]